MAVEFEPMIGRYFTLNIGGDPCRIYMEESGSGISLYVFTPPDQIRGNFGIFCQIPTSPVAFE